MLGLAGGLGGLLVARWTMQVIVNAIPSQGAGTIAATMDWRLLAFSAVLSIATGILFGLFPAISSTRLDLVSALRAQAGVGSGAGSSGRFRNSLATAQIALSMALLVAAGLFVKSLVQVSRIDLGLRAEELTTFGISPVSE